MTTNITIIGDALREINVIAETENPSAEQGSYCLRRLNQMLEAWTEDDKDLGYFEQSSTTANIPIPKWAERGVTFALAKEVAPNYGKSLSQVFIDNYRQAYGGLCRKLISKKLEPQDNDHLPIGEGHLYGHRYDIDTDQ